MAAGYGYNTYRNSHVYEGMDPERLILMLYEGALTHVRLAREGIEENDVKKRGEHLGRAIAIVSGLNSSLDSKIEDESIAFLRGLYSAILLELPKVSINNDVKNLDIASSYLARLKDIWENDVMGNGGKKEVSKEVSDKEEVRGQRSEVRGQRSEEEKGISAAQSSPVKYVSHLTGQAKLKAESETPGGEPSGSACTYNRYGAYTRAM